MCRLTGMSDLKNQGSNNYCRGGEWLPKKYRLRLLDLFSICSPSQVALWVEALMYSAFEYLGQFFDIFVTC